MLRDADAVAMLPVKDLEAAGRFYRDTLGLEPVGTEGDEAITIGSGDTTIHVYRSQYAGTNKATAVTWNVGDEIESIVRSLKAKGVAFEHYDMPEMTRKGELHVSGDFKAAWFKDPDGNILSIVNR